LNKKILTLIKQTARGRHFVSSYVLIKHCLKQLGWNNSVKSGLPVDGNNNELPWFTYSSIEFLKTRINKDLSVFEYGSGNSTVWFSKLAKRVVSIEHDKQWYKHIETKLNQNTNIEYNFKTLENKEYEKVVLDYPNQFEIIIIDGRKRVECGKNSIAALETNGVIVWDDSDRTEYQEAYDYFVTQGYKRLDFWGLAPIVAYFKCTSIFYKENNCLGI